MILILFKVYCLLPLETAGAFGEPEFKLRLNSFE